MCCGLKLYQRYLRVDHMLFYSLPDLYTITLADIYAASVELHFRKCRGSDNECFSSKDYRKSIRIFLKR